MSRTSRFALRYAAVKVIGGAAFPRLAYRLRWPTRLGPAGLVAYVAVNTIVGFAIRQWMMPAFKRGAEDRERLRQRLGREPTREEMVEELRLAKTDRS